MFSWKKIRKNLFWGSSTQFDTAKKRKLHLLALDKICSHKDSGGLGFSLLKDRNVVLLSKWFYKGYADRSSYWNIWTRGKYGCSPGDDLTYGGKYGTYGSEVNGIFEKNKISAFFKTCLSTKITIG